MSVLPDYVTKVVCYLRKSREDEEAEKRGEDTLTKQRDMMIKDVMERYSFDYDLAQEVASGDSIKDRPVFRSILPQLGTVYQAIAVKDLTRLGRGSYADMGVIFDTIMDRRVFIITRDAIYDPQNESDLQMIRISMFISREEYEMIRRRLVQGKYDGASRGKWVAGSVPFGYEYEYKKQILVPKENEAFIVRLVFDMYANKGLGFRAIATRLRQLGYKSPRGQDLWQPEVVHRMLQKQAYIGTLAFRLTRRNKTDKKVVKRPENEHIVVENAFDPIVDQDTWDKTQQRLTKGQSKPKVKLDFSPCELAGIITCAKCKRKMIRQSSKQYYTKQSGEKSVYHKEFLYCAECGYSIKYRDVESQLLSTIQRLSVLDGSMLKDLLSQMLQHHLESDTSVLEDISKQIELKRDSITKRLERARDFLLDGTLTKEEYADTKARYEKELADLQHGFAYAYSQTSATTSNMSVDIGKVQNDLRTVCESYERIGDKSERNELLSAIFDRVELGNIEKGSRTNPTKFTLSVLLSKHVLVS